MIETERLHLRRARPSDAAVITAHVNDPRLYRMVARIKPGQSEAETRAFLIRSDLGRAANTDLVFAVESDGALVGLVGFHRQSTDALFELGYWLGPKLWGQGLATEAGRAVLHWLDETQGPQDTVSGYFTENLASGRVLEKLGYVPTGLTFERCEGRDCDLEHQGMMRPATEGKDRNR